MRNRAIILFQRLVSLETKRKEKKRKPCLLVRISHLPSTIIEFRIPLFPVPEINLSKDGSQVCSGEEIPRTVIFNDVKRSCSVI